MVVLFTLAGPLAGILLYKTLLGHWEEWIIYLSGMSGALFGTMLWNIHDIARKPSRPGKNTFAKYLKGFGLGFVMGSIAGFLWGFYYRAVLIVTTAGGRGPEVRLYEWNIIFLVAVIFGVFFSLCAAIFTAIETYMSKR